MEENKINEIEINSIKDFVKDGRLDDAVNLIALYLGDSTEENYIDRLENILELLLSLHGGRTVLRFLIENLIIDIPSLLENLSKRDSVLRYTFLLVLKTICENESDLFLPYSENLLNSEDPNVREADLQLLVYMAGGDNVIDDESLIKTIVAKLTDEKEFVVEKAIQALKKIGEKSAPLVTKVLTEYVKVENLAENEILKKNIDDILKSFLTIEKIEEIVEATEEHHELDLEKEESEILDKEIELKKKELEIKKKKLELEEKEKELEEKTIKEKEKVLKLKEELLEEETKISEVTISTEKIPKKKIPKKLKKEESEILDKEIELKKKDLEIKKKKLELEEKEKELEEIEILEKEKTLKIKEELIEKEKELTQVEIELKQKIIEQKEQDLLEEEAKRVGEQLKKLGDDESENEES
ncbi:MAG: HEAT repeat domain-containing protein [Promethearchaeota archaeon]